MALDRQLQIRDDAVAREAHFLKQSADIERKAALRSWRAAAAKVLGDAFTWPADPARRAKLIGQCTGELEVMAQHLFDRGWLLKEDRLIAMVETCIAPIAAAQVAGKIADFWPYFRSAVRRHVPVNADEIQHEARRVGGAVSAADVFAGLSGLLQRPAITATEAIGERRAEARQEACKPAARGRGRPRKIIGEETLSLFEGGAV
jgi:hypothetical protein